MRQWDNDLHRRWDFTPKSPVSKRGEFWGWQEGVVNYKELPSENVHYLTGLRDSSYPPNNKFNNNIVKNKWSVKCKQYWWVSFSTIIIIPSSQVSLSELKIKLNAMKNKDVISINLHIEQHNWIYPIGSMQWWLDWVQYSSGSHPTSNLKLAKWVVGIDLILQEGLPQIGFPSVKLQWNPDFSNPWFSKPHNFWWHSSHVWVEGCRWGFETLTLFKTRKRPKTPTLFRITPFILGLSLG